MGRIPAWAELPEELLSAIASLLNPNPIDILRFRTVCKSWFSSSLSLPSSILSPLLPLTLPRPPNPLRSRHSCTTSEFSVLSATTVYALRPPSGISDSGSSLGSAPYTWVLFVDQSYPNGKLRIRRHFTKSSFSLPLDFPRKLNLLDFRASEIARFYNLSYARDCVAGDVVKVLVMSNVSIVITLSENGVLGLLRLGKGKHAMKCAEWEIIHDGKGFRFDDIVEYKGRLLGIDRRGRVYEIRNEFSEMNVIVLPITCGGGRRKRLVESRDILHLVVRCDVKGKPEKMGNIRVYQLNEKTRRWDEVKKIGDQVLFLGTSFSVSVSTQEFKDFCGKNCIMYEGYSFKKYPGQVWHCSDPWLFDRLGVGVAVYHLEDDSCIRALESYPCYFDIFWPPPPWIWLSDKAKITGTLEAVIDRLFRGIRDEIVKAKFKEFSSLVGALVSMEDVSQISEPQMVTITKETNILNRFMNEIDLEIEKQLKSIEKQLLVEDASRRTRRNFTQVPNQIGTSEDIRGCVHFVQKATHSCTSECNACDWLATEVRRRCGTLIRLSGLLKVVIKGLQKFTDLKPRVESDEQPLLSSLLPDKLWLFRESRSLYCKTCRLAVL